MPRRIGLTPSALLAEIVGLLKDFAVPGHFDSVDVVVAFAPHAVSTV